MSPKTTTSFNFSGHETFPFRYAWLKKGFDAILRDPAFFYSERAMVELGVGKNMVRSIRHWSLATKILKEDHGRLNPTILGRSIFTDNGFDPYLEDPATLWLIHWNLASDARMATTWFWAFSHWHSIEFTKDQLISGINSFIESESHKPVSNNTLKRDVDCFVRTYVHSRQTKTNVLEDSLDCPLVDLRLITELPDGKSYQFQRGPKPSLPNEVFIFALIDYWASLSSESKSNSLAFEKIAYEPGSPGRVFKLDEDSLAGRLEDIEIITSGAYRYDDTGGLKQVYEDSQKKINPFELLKSYYDTHSARAVFAG